jgi:hypothetical protein
MTPTVIDMRLAHRTLLIPADDSLHLLAGTHQATRSGQTAKKSQNRMAQRNPRWNTSDRRR